MPAFKTQDAHQPTGDPPTAIEQLAASLGAGERYQTLLGATGTGKTATMAWIIEQIQKPTLIIAHNKTLAAQLCNEFREFFPENAVEYFVSYYDYYQPEAYVPQADLYIEKDSSRNDDIDRLRHSPTSTLLSRPAPAPGPPRACFHAATRSLWRRSRASTGSGRRRSTKRGSCFWPWAKRRT